MECFDSGAGEEVDNFGKIIKVSLDPEVVLETEFRYTTR